MPLARPLIELLGYPVPLTLSQIRHALPLRQVLPDQACYRESHATHFLPIPNIGQLSNELLIDISFGLSCEDLHH